MQYTNIIDDMRWSYSRVTNFEQCPYAFLLHYIYGAEEEPMFFSDYGSFVHELIAEHLNGFAEPKDLTRKYMKEFSKSVKGQPPNEKIFGSYFSKGLNYFKSIDFSRYEVLAVEKSMPFSVGGRKFIGIVDWVARDKEDGALVIGDNKSHQLHRRSNRKTPTKGDEELDSYLRQLYLYSIPIKREFGQLPDKLVFNCFRNESDDRIIEENFSKEKLTQTKQWVSDQIEQIRVEDKWEPQPEFWKCKNICGLHGMCEYCQDL